MLSAGSFTSVFFVILSKVSIPLYTFHVHFLLFFFFFFFFFFFLLVVTFPLLLFKVLTADFMFLVF